MVFFSLNEMFSLGKILKLTSDMILFVNRIILAAIIEKKEEAGRSDRSFDTDLRDRRGSDISDSSGSRERYSGLGCS